MQYDFLKSLILIFGVSAFVVFILGRFRIPSIVGFLVAGVLLGPHGLGLINEVREVEVLAEIGVVLLMFTIGLEFSLKNLLMLRSAALGGGFLQVSITTVVIAAIAYIFYGQAVNESVFSGMLVALSSTAIAIKLLSDRAEINTPHGRVSVGILIFQDLCVVPFMLLIPALSGEGGGCLEAVKSMGKALLIVTAVLISARWGVPRMLHEVVKTRSRELFVITIILLCLGTAFFTYELGLSLALGAFLAGVVISESEYASQAVADMLPFKESFTGLFFISIGMLMNVGYFVGNPVSVSVMIILIFTLKTIVSLAASYMSGQSLRHSIQAGFYLAQVGEFSFVLAVSGRAHGLISGDIYQSFLAASVMTMLLTPFMVSASARIMPRLVSGELLDRMDRTYRKAGKQSYPPGRKDHVIVLGFGINGKNLARVLKESGIPYVILEMNANTVRKMKKAGEPIYYGDGSSVEILQKLGIRTARMLVVAISDPAATRRIVQIARHENRSMHIIVRTRYLTEIDDLKAIGANQVIPEEFETSVEIFSRVLHHYHVPENVIAERIAGVREDGYRFLRTLDLPHRALSEKHDILKAIETATHFVKEGSVMDGRSIGELRIRTETGCTVIAVQRGEETVQNPPPDFVLKRGDHVVLIGKKDDLKRTTDKYL